MLHFLFIAYGAHRQNSHSILLRIIYSFKEFLIVDLIKRFTVADELNLKAPYFKRQIITTAQVTGRFR